MVEDAGIIQAEITLKIDDLTKGAMDARKAIKDLEADLKKSKAEISSAFKEGTRAVFDYGVEIKNIELAEKTGSKTAQEAARARLQAAQKYLDVLIDVRNRIAEVNGESDKEVAVYDKLIKKQVELRDSMRDATEAGTLYVKGFGKGQVELNKRLNDFVSTMKGLNMGPLGEKIASAFSKPIFSMIPMVSAAFRAMLPAIGMVITVVAAIASTVKKGISAYKEQTKEINATKEASSRLKGTYAETTKTLEEQIKIWDRIRAAIGTIGTVLGDIGAFFRGELGTLAEIYDSQVKIVAEARILKDVNAEVNESLARYEQTLDEIQTAETAQLKDTQEANRARLSALENITDELIRQREIANDKATNTQAVKDIDERLEKLKEEKDRLEKLNNNQEKITAARNAAIEKYDQALRRANDALDAGLISEEEHARELAAARAQQYTDLEAIVAQYNLITGETVRIRDETAAIVKNGQDTEAALAEQKRREEELKKAAEDRLALFIDQEDILMQQEISRAQEAGQTGRAIELENLLIDTQRQREKEALMELAVYTKASDEEREIILENFDKITEGMKKLQEEAKKTSLFDSEGFKAGMQIGEAAVTAFSDIASAMTEITRQEATEAMEMVDRMLEEVNLKIEEGRTRALEAKGFIEATTSESIQAQIDAAIAANDGVLQYQLERRQEEMRINEEYDAKAKAAEEAAAREKAQIEYKSAVTAWEMQLAAAIANLPMTIMNATEAGWNAGKLIPAPWVAPALAATYATLAGISSGAQLSILSSSKPKPPHFATGGIVPGQPHTNADTIAAMVSPGELILNRAQQETVAAQMGGPLTVQIILDGRKIGETVIEDYVNKGRILIDASRGIR